jgi:hypothetical protein
MNDCLQPRINKTIKLFYLVPANMKIKWVMRQRRIPAANYIHLFNEIK